MDDNSASTKNLLKIIYYNTYLYVYLLFKKFYLLFTKFFYERFVKLLAINYHIWRLWTISRQYFLKVNLPFPQRQGSPLKLVLCRSYDIYDIIATDFLS